MRRFSSTLQGKIQCSRLEISSATESKNFDLPGLANYAIIGTTSVNGRTLTLQIKDEEASGWLDTALTVVTSNTTKQQLAYTDFLPYVGLAGRGDMFRFTLDVADSVVINLYGN